jgi:hypothetical protein
MSGGDEEHDNVDDRREHQADLIDIERPDPFPRQRKEDGRERP